MFFSLAKFVWILANPLNLTLLLLCLATLLIWLGWRRLAGWIVSLLTIALLAIAVLPVGSWLLAPLEEAFATYEPDARPVTGIVLLSGAAVNLRVSHQMGHAVPGHAAARLVEFMRLAKAYPKAKLLVSGGNTDGAGARPEAAVIAEYLVSRGIPAARILVEDQSRDTFENAVMSQKLANPAAKDRWLLVTSNWHMPRAMAVFQARGWAVAAAPPVKKTGIDSGLRFNLRSGMRSVGVALHEYIGLLGYWANGRIKSPWPVS